MKQFVTVVPLIRVIRGKDRFTYQTELSLRVGELVWTPWRSRAVVGVVTELNVASYPNSKTITDRLQLVLPAAYWKFALWFQDYYYLSLASALHAMLPDFVRKPRAQVSQETVVKLRVGIANQKRLELIQQVVAQTLTRTQPITVLYQRLNEVAAVMLGIVKGTTGPIVLICPEEVQLRYWQGVLASYRPLVVEAKRSSSVREAWYALLQRQSRVILGTKRLALLPLTEAAKVMVMDPEHTAHKQWDQNPRYHVQRVTEQQTNPIFFSYAPRLEQYAQHPCLDLLLTPDYLPELTVVRPVFNQIFTPAVQDQVAAATTVVVWHQRTGLGRSLVCKTCHHWIPDLQATACPQCHSQTLRVAGFGTGMLKRQLAQWYPDRPVIEVTAATPIPDLTSADRPIYVGTTAAFNRLPWSSVDLVVATSLDAQLAWPDFRSHEFALQQLIWLRNHVSKLIVQTYAAEHPVLQALMQPFPTAWYRTTLSERRKFHYPPRGEYYRAMNTVTKEERLLTNLEEMPASTDWIIDREC